MIGHPIKIVEVSLAISVVDTAVYILADFSTLHHKLQLLRVSRYLFIFKVTRKKAFEAHQCAFQQTSVHCTTKYMLLDRLSDKKEALFRTSCTTTQTTDIAK